MRLLRRTFLASTGESELVFDPFTASVTTAVAAKELNHTFVGYYESSLSRSSEI